MAQSVTAPVATCMTLSQKENTPPNGRVRMQKAPPVRAGLSVLGMPCAQSRHDIKNGTLDRKKLQQLYAAKLRFIFFAMAEI